MGIGVFSRREEPDMLQSVYIAEVTELRDRVAYLEAELARRDTCAVDDVGNLMRGHGISVGIARVLVALSSGKTMTRDQLAILCVHNSDGDIRLVDCQIKRVRKAVPAIKITTLYGIGYCIDEPYLSKLRMMIRSNRA